ncbi:hypothetical protein C5167_028210 [Papaver somniferum]|nr:hypothetical protein C5167_028210 [Papaver somniferum]
MNLLFNGCSSLALLLLSCLISIAIFLITVGKLCGSNLMRVSP